MKRLLAAAGAATLAFCGGGALAQETRDFCPDRPGLGTPACTIDRGHIALELGLLDWTHDSDGADESDEIATGDVLLRYGVTGSLEVQLGWTAYTHVRTRSGIVADSTDGVGDLLVAARQNLLHPDGSGFSIALMPFATLPTGSDGIGAGDWGGGLIVPMSYELPGGFSLGVTAEADAAVDEDGDGRHFAYSGIIGLDIPLTDALGATIELSAGRDEDPSGHSTEMLAGLSAGWMPNDDLQLDVGANVGLNEEAADVQLYVGIAKRF
ncbi:MAG: transporter [Alphaproteobacteria bacterium]|nr:MAG: transporter [Alphaproteobacteria bacterium]